MRDDGVAARLEDAAEEESGVAGERVDARRPLDVARPAPDRVEQGPDDVWRAAVAVITEVVGRAGPPAAVRLVGDPDALVLWDRETLGSPLPVVAGPDRRAAGVCERLRASGDARRVAALAGGRLDPRALGPKAAWLAEHEARTWWSVEQGRYAIGDPASYLLARLTRGLEHGTDRASAHRTLLLDRATGTWSAELAALFGVPLDALPELDVAAVTDATVLPGIEVPVSLGPPLSPG